MQEVFKYFYAYISRFLIPKGINPQGVNFAAVITNYIDALHHDRVDTTGTTAFIKRGSKMTKTSKSSFASQPIGKNTLYKVGEEIASYLGLEDANLYTGHTFRRAAAQRMADEGASTMELRNMFGWKDDKMPSIYVANSMAKMTKQAKMLSGIDVNANLMQEKQKTQEADEMQEKQKTEKADKMQEKRKMPQSEDCDDEPKEPVKKCQKIEMPTNERGIPNHGVFATSIENCQITINYMKSE